MQPIKISNVETKEDADLFKLLLKLEHPTWTVEIKEHPGGKFSVVATPPAAAGKPQRVSAISVTHPQATVAQTMPLLDLIAQAESSGNYNAHFDKPGNTNPKFTAMTIDAVLDWQKAFVNAGSVSSAVGRYQILRGTLKGLRKNLKLDGSELFDNARQDEMAVSLLKGRGLERFLLGTLSQDEFINQIAMEWAGLPNMNGKSHYYSDGVNSANVALADVQDVVSALR